MKRVYSLEEFFCPYFYIHFTSASYNMIESCLAWSMETTALNTLFDILLEKSKWN